MRLHLSAAIRHWARYKPSQPSIITTDKIYSFYNLNCAVDNICAKIISVKDATTVAIVVKNKALFVASIAACIRAGKIFVSVNHNDPSAHIEQVRNTIGAKCVILSDLPDLDTPADWIFERLTIDDFQQRDYCFEDVECDAYRTAGIIFTSGTSLTPKGVIRNHFSLLSEAILWAVELKLSQNTRFLIARPFFYTGGFVLMYTTLFFGGQILTDNDDNETLLYKRSITNPVDIAFLVPQQIQKMIGDDLIPREKFANVVLTMGAPISSVTKTKFATLFFCEFIEVWGNSEGLGTIAEPEDLRRRPDSIGRPFFCDSLFITDKGGHLLKNGGIGYLSGYSDNQYDNYLHEAPTSPASCERLMISEDMGYVDENGYFFIMGRESERIFTSEYELFPAHVEKIAVGHHSVVDAAVALLPNSDREFRLILYVVGKGPLDHDDLRLFINSRLQNSPFVDEVYPVSAIPRNSGGKIERAKLNTLLGSYNF